MWATSHAHIHPCVYLLPYESTRACVCVCVPDSHSHYLGTAQKTKIVTDKPQKCRTIETAGEIYLCVPLYIYSVVYIFI